jgi:hypothetical protein
MPKPDMKRCHLWLDSLSREQVTAALEIEESYLVEYHETRELMRCRSCGQLYFSHWVETVNFRGGEDWQDQYLIPVSDREEGRVLKSLARPALGSLPMLVLTWPAAGTGAHWVNR